MELKDITVVIATFKSDNKIYTCLDSIPKGIRIFVVENSNNQKFKDQLTSKYSNVECILLGENKGYSFANNIGLSKVSSRFALVLNPDTKLNKESIDNFFTSAKKFPDFWLIGPGNQNSNTENLKKNKIFEVANIKGFAMFFNIKKFNQSFFDENYFLYFEEIDLCTKINQKKGKIFIDPNITIFHEGGGSVNAETSSELEKNRNWHWMWSTFYYHKKYKGNLIALFIIFPKLVSSLLKTIFYSLIMNKEKRDIYFNRLSGIINSIFKKKSWRRPTID